jgi:hypothetical protein
VKTTPAARRECAVINRSRDFGFANKPLWCVVCAMRRVKTRVRGLKRRRVAGARLVMLATLLAFAVQTYLTLTHIHFASEGQSSRVHTQLVLGGGKVSIGAPVERKDRYPANEDPANCPLCQELIHAGQFVTPAASALLLPSLSLSVIELTVQYAPLLHTVTHIWRGRAPPLG